VTSTASEDDGQGRFETREDPGSNPGSSTELGATPRCSSTSTLLDGAEIDEKV
jgi:hypothetical protein